MSYLISKSLSTTSLALAALLLLSPMSHAQLSPFEATYSSQWDLGISLSGKAQRSLIHNSDGSYRLTTQASALVASLTESSLFNYHEGQITPQHYSYQRKILNKTREVEVAFNWPEQQVVNTAQGSAWSMDIEANTLDKQSVQLRLQLDIKANPKLATYTYVVADGGYAKPYRFVTDGEDLIDTPLGQFSAIRIKRDRGEDTERQTWIWFAPGLDYTIVRIVQQEADGKRYQLNLQQLNWLDN